MRWKGRRESTHVEDRRGSSPRRVVGGGGLLLLIGVAVVVILMGGDPSEVIDQIGSQGPGTTTPIDPAQAERAQFVKVVLAETEDVWNAVFQAEGLRYEEPGLVLFSRGAQSGCGFATSAVGPFYCPADNKIYVDLTFFEELAKRFGAPGDFAQAYVIAHEVGHHVQRLLGYARKVDSARGHVDEKEYNRLSVRLELQADFLAGVWAFHTKRKDLLEAGDYEEAIRAANAIGDDTLQRQGQGKVMPDSFTHGTSKQRMAWFRLGYETGDLNQGNTFDDTHFHAVNRR